MRSLLLHTHKHAHAHTHTHTYIYIYIMVQKYKIIIKGKCNLFAGMEHTTHMIYQGRSVVGLLIRAKKSQGQKNQ